jgi:hypothetical protein
VLQDQNGSGSKAEALESLCERPVLQYKVSEDVVWLRSTIRRVSSLGASNPHFMSLPHSL